ncbi:putative GTP-binding protein YPT31/YPT8 (putative) [Pseudozyma hubeiensis]|nr:putative GTP-binding protein YPT31/YPT8 (putative) [Pseudozyma hubeiensis]
MAPPRIPSASYTSSSTASPSTAPPSSGWDYILKFILIGDSSVGKSSLLVRLTDDRFLTSPDPTIGVEFGSHLIRLDNGETVKVQVWDTAGSESFRSITRSYYRGAAGALLVYDVTHRASFANVKSWLDDVRSNAEEKVTVVLVGNMYDLVEQEDGMEEEAEARLVRRRSKGARRQVSTQEAKEFAEKEGLLFVEASAKTGWNVKEAFALAAKDIHEKFSQADAEGGNGDARQGADVGSGRDTLGKRSRMRARAGGRTSGTVSLDQQHQQQSGSPQAQRNVSGFSIRSLTGGGAAAQQPSGDGSASDVQPRGAAECCIIC